MFLFLSSCYLFYPQRAVTPSQLPPCPDQSITGHMGYRTVVMESLRYSPQRSHRTQVVLWFRTRMTLCAAIMACWARLLVIHARKCPRISRLFRAVRSYHRPLMTFTTKPWFNGVLSRPLYGSVSFSWSLPTLFFALALLFKICPFQRCRFLIVIYFNLSQINTLL